MTQVRAHERRTRSPAMNPGAPFYPDIARRLAYKQRRSLGKPERLTSASETDDTIVAIAERGNWLAVEQGGFL